MSSTPDEYAPPASHSHKRQDSHSYFRSDPYRAARKSTTPDSTGSSQQTDHHSRTASESSTSRLAPAAGSRFNGYEYYDDDPYALPPRHETHLNKKTRRKQHHASKDERANSYLPYSHHRRDPYAAQEPIYLEEDNMPSFTSPNKNNSMGGVGSLLQDNIAMDMVDQQPPAVAHNQPVDPTLDPLPEIKRKRSRRLCGLRRRTLVFIVFIFVVIVAVIWYFVWPRYPPLYYLEARATYDAPPSETSITSTWYVNMTADNSENWVPTRIENFEVELFDANANQKFGSGSSGSITLPPRQSNINVPFTFNIQYSSSNQDDTTLQDLQACGPVPQNPTPVSPRTMNVIFQVTYHIQGIAWTKQSTVRPSGFQCPNS